MATAAAPIINSAQASGSGVTEAKVERDPVLPSQEAGYGFPVSNVTAEIILDEAMPDARPTKVCFAGLRDPELRLLKAIPMDVSLEEGSVVVCWSEINEFGTGDTFSDALDDFGAGLRELYHRLYAPNAELGTDLQRVKDALANYIQPRK